MRSKTNQLKAKYRDRTNRFITPAGEVLSYDSKDGQVAIVSGKDLGLVSIDVTNKDWDKLVSNLMKLDWHRYRLTYHLVKLMQTGWCNYGIVHRDLRAYKVRIHNGVIQVRYHGLNLAIHYCVAGYLTAYGTRYSLATCCTGGEV